MIRYVQFEVSLHGLSISKLSDLEPLKRALLSCARGAHTHLRDLGRPDLEGDVVVEFVEHAGTEE